jgi:hypothetical protein
MTNRLNRCAAMRPCKLLEPVPKRVEWPRCL